jgi:two-component system response regulator NreC
MGPSPTTILVAEDHAMVRSGLSLILNAEEDLEVVAQAEDIDETRRRLGAYKPTILLLDVNLNGESSLKALPELLTASPETRCVVVTMQAEVGFAREALRAGASGYLLKEAADRELVEAVRTCAAGSEYVQPAIGARLAAAGEEEPPDGLSPREAEVLRLIALGHTNNEIAEELYLSMRTIESHRAHIQQKLGVRTRAELVRYALERGMLDDEVSPQP